MHEGRDVGLRLNLDFDEDRCHGEVIFGEIKTKNNESKFSFFLFFLSLPMFHPLSLTH